MLILVSSSPYPSYPGTWRQNPGVPGSLHSSIHHGARHPHTGKLTPDTIRLIKKYLTINLTNI